MLRSDPTDGIVDQTRALERARYICAMLRQEGVIGRAPYAVVHLADSLLKSLTLR
jgi:hypothetical protein